MPLSITICSWNTIDDTRACLQSLRESGTEAEFEVIVVDNNSEDGSPEMIATEFPEFTLLAQSRNLGFTGGHNLALKHASGEHKALLNSDTVVHPGAVGTILEFMATHPEAGVVGPKLLNPDGTLQYSCRRFPNPVAAAFRNTLLGKLFPNNRYTKDYLMQDWGHSEPREVDWVSGAALFIRGDCLQAIGPLDDSLFMFCEDVDWCKRAWNAGFKVMYCPQAVITHAIGRSTDKAPNRMIARFHRSMFRYYKKHNVREAPAVARPFLLAFAACALSARASIFLVKNKVDVLRRKIRR
ncbi:MAG: glycosyltransferase family 2 protein [Armatimonadetes bacterium]|nr:glycosyltransferase family 2 protein [Armatimonadota bacterium]MBS1711479.1 glycosyltransferase family 2 protein [Armatimonadota bacterium]MBX3107596.1 glycosyltransferase family 2 protein [Fimbriimonadaceae bacterium]